MEEVKELSCSIFELETDMLKRCEREAIWGVYFNDRTSLDILHLCEEHKFHDGIRQDSAVYYRLDQAEYFDDMSE